MSRENWPMVPTSMLTASRSRQLLAASQSAEAYRLIKDQIITLQLAPASLIDESRISAELGIGRTPIREALLRLQLENLIIILPRRGTIVADLNPRDLKKLYEIRVELEPYAAGIAAQRATPLEIAALEQWSERTAGIIRAGNSYQMLTADSEGHRLIAVATHNEFLAETLERLYGPALRLSYWYAAQYPLNTLPRQVDELRQIVVAIKASDSACAERLMRDHIAVFLDELLTIQ